MNKTDNTADYEELYILALIQWKKKNNESALTHVWQSNSVSFGWWGLWLCCDMLPIDTSGMKTFYLLMLIYDRRMFCRYWKNQSLNCFQCYRWMGNSKLILHSHLVLVKSFYTWNMNMMLVLNVWIIFMYLIQRQHNLPVLLPQYSVASMSVELSFDVAHSSVCPPGFTLQSKFTALGWFWQPTFGLCK